MADNRLSFSTYQRQAKRKPLELELPDGNVITVPVPDGDKMMDLEEAGLTRRALKIAFGEQWADVQPLMKTIQEPEALRDFTKAVMTALGVANDDAPPADGPR